MAHCLEGLECFLGQFFVEDLFRERDPGHFLVLDPVGNVILSTLTRSRAQPMPFVFRPLTFVSATVPVGLGALSVEITIHKVTHILFPVLPVEFTLAMPPVLQELTHIVIPIRVDDPSRPMQFISNSLSLFNRTVFVNLQPSPLLFLSLVDLTVVNSLIGISLRLHILMVLVSDLLVGVRAQPLPQVKSLLRQPGFQHWEVRLQRVMLSQCLPLSAVPLEGFGALELKLPQLFNFCFKFADCV